MGLFNPDENNQMLDQAPAPAPLQEPTEAAPLSGPETARLIQRGGEQNAWYINLLHNGIGDWSKSNPDFNPWAEIQDTKYAQHPDYFTNVDNQDELHTAMQKVDELNEYQDLSSRAPSLSFWSGMAWGMIDPALAIPGMGTIKPVLLERGVSATATAAKTGAISAAVIAGEEAITAQNHPERTASESAVNIAAAGVVGSVFGGLVGKAAQESVPAVRAVDQMATTKMPEMLPIQNSEIQAKDAVSRVLSITEDAIPAPVEEAKMNLPSDGRAYSIADKLEEFNNEIVPTPVAEIPDPVSEEQLAKYLTPSSSGEFLADETRSTSAAYMTYDARVQGLPQWAVKAVAVPHVMPVNLEALASPSNHVRYLATRLWEQHLPMDMTNPSGSKATPISLESMLHQDTLQTLDLNKTVSDNYLRYLQISPDSMHADALAFVKSKGKNVLTRTQFDEAVRDTIETGRSHPIKEVQNAADYTRNLFAERFKMMQDVGLIDKNTAPKPNYFKWVYNIPQILGNRKAFEDELITGFVRHDRVNVHFTDALGNAKIEKGYQHNVTKELDWQPRSGEKITKIEILARNNDLAEAQLAAREATNKILQLGDKSLELGDVDRLNFERGSDSSRPRVLDSFVNYEQVKQFLVQDFKTLSRNYLAATSRAIRGKQMLDDLGLEKPGDMRIRVRDEFDNSINKINSIQELPQAQINKLPKEEQIKFIDPAVKKKLVEKITKQSISSEKLLNDMLAIAMGQFKKRTAADPFWRMTNQYNAVRLLWGVTISSLGDPTAMLIKNSISDTVWHGWTSELRRMISGTNVLKKQDMRDALTATQNEVDDAIRYLMNPDATPYGVGPIEKAMQGVGQFNQKVTGLQYWNNFWQRATHTVAEARILRNMKKGWDGLSGKEQKYLLELGIDKDSLNKIAAMQKEFGYDIKGTHISNAKMWSDEQAKMAFLNAIRLEVRKAPIMAGQGDLPRFFSRSDFRRTMFQFKGFPAAAATKLALSMAARHDSRALTGLIGLVSAGMMVKLLKDKIAGKDSNYSLSEWIMHGIDKSGVLGLLADPLFQAKYTYENTKNYGTQGGVTSPLEYIFGPNASIINPIYSGIMEKAAGKPIDKKTEYQLKALIPYFKLYNLLKGQKK